MQSMYVTKVIPFSIPQLDCQDNIMHSSEQHRAQFGRVGMHRAHWALCK